MGGEGLSEIYVALATVLAVLIPGERPPLAVLYDNACALRSFVRNEKRASLSPVVKHMSLMKFILDIWHRWNHLHAANAC